MLGQAKVKRPRPSGALWRTHASRAAPPLRGDGRTGVGWLHEEGVPVLIDLSNTWAMRTSRRFADAAS